MIFTPPQGDLVHRWLGGTIWSPFRRGRASA
jgi:hypothetical protein